MSRWNQSKLYYAYEFINKKSLYRKHWISQPVRIISTNTKMDKERQKRQQQNITCHVSHASCHVSCAMCHISCVACHLSLTATATATNPPPANSPIIHNRLVYKIQKPKTFKTKKNQTKKIYIYIYISLCDGRPIFAIRPLSRGLQSIGKGIFCNSLGELQYVVFDVKIY